MAYSHLKHRFSYLYLKFASSILSTLVHQFNQNSLVKTSKKAVISYTTKKPLFKGIPLNKGFLITGVVGIEPTSGVLETLILPMNYTPICNLAQGYLYHNCVEMSNKY